MELELFDFLKSSIIETLNECSNFSSANQLKIKPEVTEESQEQKLFPQLELLTRLVRSLSSELVWKRRAYQS